MAPALSCFSRKNSIITPKHPLTTRAPTKNRYYCFIFFKKDFVNSQYLLLPRCEKVLIHVTDEVMILGRSSRWRGFSLPFARNLVGGMWGVRRNEIGRSVCDLHMVVCTCGCSLSPRVRRSVGKEAWQRCVKCQSSPEPPTTNKD